MAIIRDAIECETCGQPHTVRVGMGQDETQEHRFSCRQCKEEIVIHLDVDYKNVSAEVRCGANCKPATEVIGAPIVSLDANFLIGDADQGRDMVFPRLTQVWKIAEEARAKNRLVDVRALSATKRNSRPYRRPDYLDEWKRLKRAWSLARNDKDKLSKRIVVSASEDFYSSEPLNDLPDWVWRISLFLSQPIYETKLRDAMEAIKDIDQSRLSDLGDRHERELVKTRADLYFASFNEFFSGYSEYAQVLFAVSRGDALPLDRKATSHGFESVRMAYGNLFESFTSLIELPVLLNNVLRGRDHDKFEQLKLEEYRRLDKSSRCNPLRDTPALFALCDEADNQLRNASHHNGMKFEPGAQIISYRAGKGGTGSEQSLTYVEYLSRCVRIFLQILTVLRMELILCKQLGWALPIK